MIEHELRLLLASLRQHPGLNALMVLSVAVGVAALVVGRGATQSQLRDPVPDHRGVHHVQLEKPLLTGQAGRREVAMVLSRVALYSAYRDVALLQAPAGAQWRGAATLAAGASLRTQASEPERLDVRFCTPSLFAMFDFAFERGAAWDEQQERDAASVAVIDARTARALFGGREAVGESIEVAGRALRIVGVLRDPSMPHLYDFPRTDVMEHARVYAPLSLAPVLGVRPRYAFVNERHDDSLRALYASEDLLVQLWVELPSAGARRAFQQHLDGYLRAARAQGRPLTGARLTTAREFLHRSHDLASGYAIFSLLASFMLGVCLLGFARLLLAKSLTQHALSGMHRAFGASRARLFSRVLGEAVALSLLGALLGLALATLGLWAIETALPHRIAAMSIDHELAALGIVAALLTGVLAGAYPAWRLARTTPARLLRRI